MPHPDKIDNSECETDDDEPHESASVLTSHAPHIEIDRVRPPGWQGEPDLRVPRSEIFPRGTKEPDDAHAETDREEQKPGARGVEGRRRSRVEGGQVTVESAPPQQARLDEMDNGGTEAESKTDVTEKGDSHMDAEPWVTHEDIFGPIKADRHEHRVEEAEKGERCDEQIQLPHSRQVLDEDAGEHQGHDEDGDDEEHVRER